MDEKDITDPDPEQQDPESGSGGEQHENLSEFEDDPSRNPDDPNLEKYKGA
jgi:hypothetical protein